MEPMTIREIMDAVGGKLLGEFGDINRMACIEDQVGGFETEGVGIGMLPLLQYFVSNAPYKDGRMLTVAQDLVCQVLFMPFVKILGIVVR